MALSIGNEPSILKSIRKSLGYENTNEFDTDILISLNSALAILTQLGVGPKEGFEVIGEDQTWEDFLGPDKRLSMAKQFALIRTKILFDGSSLTSSLLSSYESMAKELEWRLLAQASPYKPFDV